MSPQVKLRPKQLKDAINDYLWRSDAALAALDATAPLGIPFSEYLDLYAAELSYGAGDCQRFAIETPEGKHIGNCMCSEANCPRGEVELGIMIGDRDYWGQGYGAAAVRHLLEHIFTATDVKRVYLRTLANNYRAQRCFEKCGFVRYGSTFRDSYSFLMMDIGRRRWQALASSVTPGR